MILKDELKEYFKRKKINPKTIKNYLYYYDLLDEPELLSQEQVNKFLNKYNNPSPRAFISHLISFLKKHGEIKIDKISGKKAKKIPPFISYGELLKLAGKLGKLDRGYMKRLMLMIQYQGGLRVSELIILTPHNFFMKEWKKNPHGVLNIKVKGKYGKERIVYIQPEIAYKLKKYVNELDKSETANDDKGKTIYWQDLRIFRNLGRKRYLAILKTLGEKYLGKSIGTHTIRHSTATHMLNGTYCGGCEPFTIDEIKEYLGHESIVSTQIYIHLDKNMLKSKFNVGEVN